MLSLVSKKAHGQRATSAVGLGTRGPWDTGGARDLPLQAAPVTHSQLGKGLCQKLRVSPPSCPQGASRSSCRVAPGPAWAGKSGCPRLEQHLCPSAQVSCLPPSLASTLSSHLLNTLLAKIQSLVIYSGFPLATPNDSVRQKYLLQETGRKVRTILPPCGPHPAPGSRPEGSEWPAPSGCQL